MDLTLKGRIEAVLFLTGRALSIAEIAEKLSESSDDIEMSLLELISDYSFREESALEIDDADGYILQVKSTYDAVVHKMVPVDLSTAAIRTLSAIAIHGPILQSDLIEARGSGAYEQIRELAQQQLIYKRRKERSYMLSVTPKFHSYFKLTGDKNELKNLVSIQREAAAHREEAEAPEAFDVEQPQDTHAEALP